MFFGGEHKVDLNNYIFKLVNAGNVITEHALAFSVLSPYCVQMFNFQVKFFDYQNYGSGKQADD